MISNFTLFTAFHNYCISLTHRNRGERANTKQPRFHLPNSNWRVLRQLMFALTLFSFSNLSFGSYFCTGELNTTIISSNGYVGVRADNIFGDANTRFICNLNEEWNNIGIETCKVLASKLLSKEVTKVDVKFQYTDELTCESQPHGESSSKVWSIH